jgi:hypothetical protein
MMTIKADLTSITSSGLLQARLNTLEPEAGHLVVGERVVVGDRVVVIDLFGSERFPAVIESIDGESGTVLLDVSWDEESPVPMSAHAGRPRYGMPFSAGITTRSEGNHVHSVKMAARARSA